MSKVKIKMILTMSFGSIIQNLNAAKIEKLKLVSLLILERFAGYRRRVESQNIIVRKMTLNVSAKSWWAFLSTELSVAA